MGTSELGRQNTDCNHIIFCTCDRQFWRANIATIRSCYASRYVSRLPQATTSPYLTRKNVTAAPGVRINPGDELVIPFSNAQGKIRTYQRIPETGGKDARLAADNIANGYSMTVQPVQVSTRTAARGIFEMELCKYAINSGLNDFNQTARYSTSLMTESSRTAGGNYTVTVSNSSGICGTASLSVEGNGTTNQSSISKFFNPFSSTEYNSVIRWPEQHSAK